MYSVAKQYHKVSRATMHIWNLGKMRYGPPDLFHKRQYEARRAIVSSFQTKKLAAW